MVVIEVRIIMDKCALECHQRERENTSLDVPNEVSGTFKSSVMQLHFKNL